MASGWGIRLSNIQRVIRCNSLTADRWPQVALHHRPRWWLFINIAPKAVSRPDNFSGWNLGSWHFFGISPQNRTGISRHQTFCGTAAEAWFPKIVSGRIWIWPTWVVSCSIFTMKWWTRTARWWMSQAGNRETWGSPFHPLLSCGWQLKRSRSQNHQVPSRSDSAVQSDHEKLRCPLDAWTKKIMTSVSSPDFTSKLGVLMCPWNRKTHEKKGIQEMLLCTCHLFGKKHSNRTRKIGPSTFPAQ